MNIIGAKWVFKVKYDNTLKKLKVRLAAKGHNQEEGVDYFNIFSRG